MSERDLRKTIENSEIDIDQAIFEAEKEVEEGADPIPAKTARKRLDKKYFG